ncbi:MAG: RagB/SusD family nutrient uptake outer membrane protein [Bacteroides sp.]|nr:RagB/SusD family nutrient uptake outer membrane protein [Bacteroides sp.]
MKLLDIKFLTMAVGIALSSVSCSDYLDTAPYASISDASFWTGESDAILALTGCYRAETGWSHDAFDAPQGLIYLDLAAGMGSEKESFTTNMASVNTLATNGNIQWYWGNAYVHIARHNTFLENIANCPMDEDKKAEFIAEVKTLRSFFLYQLAFYYKDVPMPLSPLTLSEANFISQTPQEDVYDQVEKDLLEAIPNLPMTRSGDEYGRMTAASARAILGRVYLAREKWTEAANILRPIIESGDYQLDRRNGLDSYEKLFQVGGEYSPEMIYVIMGIKDKFTSSRNIYLSPECLGGWHQFAVYNEHVKSYFCADGKSIDESPLYDENDPYMNRDQRLYASVFLPPLGSWTGSVFNDVTYDCYGEASSADRYNKFALFNGYCPKKGLDPGITEAMWTCYTPTPIIRYAEILLSYLEAVNEAGMGISQEMIDLTINDIRDRVNLPGYALAELSSQEKIRKAVRAERRVELAFEGLHYFDILRWGTAKDELNHYFTGVKLSDDPEARNYKGTSPVDENNYYKFEERKWDNHNRYWPIPQADRNINPNLKQNEGYN